VQYNTEAECCKTEKQRAVQQRSGVLYNREAAAQLRKRGDEETVFMFIKPA
jgi:hypothetical protein